VWRDGCKKVMETRVCFRKIGGGGKGAQLRILEQEVSRHGGNRRGDKKGKLLGQRKKDKAENNINQSGQVGLGRWTAKGAQQSFRQHESLPKRCTVKNHNGRRRQRTAEERLVCDKGAKNGSTIISVNRGFVGTNEK